MSSIRALSLLLVASLFPLQPARAQSPIAIGDTTLESAPDSGNGNLVVVQAAALPQSATLVSLSFYVTQASGNLVLGVYDATGPDGGPGKLLAATKSFAAAAGWNTVDVVTPVSLVRGTYWLGYLPSSSSLAFLKQNSSGSCFYSGRRFTRGMPAAFATSKSDCSPTTWSFYATLSPASNSADTVNGACGSSNGANLTSAPTTNLCSAGNASAVGGSGPWNWTCAASGGGTGASCSAQLQVNGSCGPANGLPVSAAPTTNLCSAGSASTVSGNGPWAWSCLGSHGGSTSSCSAPRTQQVVNGSCGLANGVPVSTAPTTNLCSAGSPSTVSGTGPWDWSCTGSAGGNTASCSAPAIQQVVNGSCGSANGVPVSTAPTTNLCSVGSASAVSGAGPWNWSCTGSNGGTPASCAWLPSAALPRPL